MSSLPCIYFAFFIFLGNYFSLRVPLLVFDSRCLHISFSLVFDSLFFSVSCLVCQSLLFFPLFPYPFGSCSLLPLSSYLDSFILVCFSLYRASVSIACCLLLLFFLCLRFLLCCSFINISWARKSTIRAWRRMRSLSRWKKKRRRRNIAKACTIALIYSSSNFIIDHE